MKTTTPTMTFDAWMKEATAILADVSTVRFSARWNTHWKAHYLLGISPLKAVTSMIRQYRVHAARQSAIDAYAREEAEREALGIVGGRDQDDLPLVVTGQTEPRRFWTPITSHETSAADVRGYFRMLILAAGVSLLVLLLRGVL